MNKNNMSRNRIFSSPVKDHHMKKKRKNVCAKLDQFIFVLKNAISSMKRLNENFEKTNKTIK